MAEALAIVFSDKTKPLLGGAYQKKRDRADNCISEEFTTPIFEDGRRVLSMNKNLKLPQSGASPGVFLPDKTKKMFMGCFKKKNVGDKSISEVITTTSFRTSRGVFVKKKV